HGTVTVTVTRAGAAEAGDEVGIESDNAIALAGDRARVATTDAAGHVSVSMPLGQITAHVLDSVTGARVEATGVVTGASPLALTIDLPTLATRLTVHVFASDGATPLPGASVTLTGGSSATTDASGTAVFAAVPPGGASLAVTFGTAHVERALTLI